MNILTLRSASSLLVLLIVLSVTMPCTLQAADTAHVDRVVIGKLECGRNISFKESKLEAGLALALNLSKSISSFRVMKAIQ